MNISHKVLILGMGFTLAVLFFIATGCTPY